MTLRVGHILSVGGGRGALPVSAVPARKSNALSINYPDSACCNSGREIRRPLPDWSRSAPNAIGSRPATRRSPASRGCRRWCAGTTRVLRDELAERVYTALGALPPAQLRQRLALVIQVLRASFPCVR
ncbi:Rap1a/Tai family immunity protein [Xanthomonas sp. WHRI 7945]|nr:hypothetical protein [Xanthomonas campestris pv. campestris]